MCGSNNVTYPNLCSLRFADCEFENDEKITLKHEGPCERKGIKIKCPYFQKKVFSVNVDAGFPIKLMEKPLSYCLWYLKHKLILFMNPFHVLDLSHNDVKCAFEMLPEI